MQRVCVQAKWEDEARRTVAAQARKQWRGVERTGLLEERRSEALWEEVSHLPSKLATPSMGTWDCTHQLAGTHTDTLSHCPFFFVGVKIWMCPSQHLSIHPDLHIIISWRGPKHDH